jgi:uncharacterized membrane protein
MNLTPEERKKIYEEEKNRLEAREQLEKERGRASSSPSPSPSSSSESTLNITQNAAGLLCYLFGWVSGIVFLVMEQKNKWIRFHAAQSIVVFAPLCILYLIFWWIPWIGWIISIIIGIFTFILWVLLMYKAYQGERFKLPLVGDIAESLVGAKAASYQSTPPESAAKSATAPPPPPPPPPRAPKSRKTR